MNFPYSERLPSMFDSVMQSDWEDILYKTLKITTGSFA